jgi:serine/threonine-protein kinase
MASLVNALIGEYRVTELLGAGGMGEVYKAKHTRLARVIAIKVLSAGTADASLLRRFYGEANIQASLRHPGVAEYLGFYEYQGRPCILMEYVDGETLAAIIERRGPLPAAEAYRIARSLAAVIAHFHAQGVVHRDIKSNNVKINSAGTVKVLDFGIARLESTHRSTSAGMLVGTPVIAAPEQVKGGQVTPATDVWQLGVLMYEMLTGRLPFQGTDSSELFLQIVNADFTPISHSQHSVPRDFEKIINRCLQKDPLKRYASGRLVLAALDAADPCATNSAPALVRSGVRRKPLSAYVAVASVLLLASIILVLIVILRSPSSD